jgi:glycosyltransferase involved in cell wall biosynthesis
MKQSLVLLTVIIPVYNVKPYLDRCLDSVVNQTYRNLDIILVDDGSTDGSGKLCDEYQKKDSRIRVIHQKNEGLSEARNAGLAQARGGLLAFVDSDDWLAPDAYTVAVGAHLDTQADISVFGYYRVYEHKKKIEKPDFFILPLILQKEDALYELICNDKINNYAWNKIYNRNIFDGLSFPPGRVYEDIYIMHKLFLRAEKISVVCARLYYYLQRRDSLANSRNLNNELRRFEAYIYRFHDLQNNPQVNPEILLVKTASAIIDIFYMFPFRIKGEYKQKMAGFLAEHRAALLRCPLQLRDRLFLILPFVLFLVVYNPLSVTVYLAFKRAKNAPPLPL